MPQNWHIPNLYNGFWNSIHLVSEAGPLAPAKDDNFGRHPTT